MNTNNSEFQPCPFCGSYRVRLMSSCQYCFISCSDCESNGPTFEIPSEEEEPQNKVVAAWKAMDAWNKRR